MDADPIDNFNFTPSVPEMPSPFGSAFDFFGSCPLPHSDGNEIKDSESLFSNNGGFNNCSPFNAFEIPTDESVNQPVTGENLDCESDSSASNPKEIDKIGFKAASKKISKPKKAAPKRSKVPSKPKKELNETK